ncbi:MAG: hypothetical protein GF355_16735 [Candidatus Eisenbacteria bacterium]|nr:hypothetical protein [Candidatus Eisenbacteria bacterium]
MELLASPGTPASVSVFDVTGRMVRVLWEGAVQESPQTILWDGRTTYGRPAAPGLYFVRLTGPNREEHRVTLLR